MDQTYWCLEDRLQTLEAEKAVSLAGSAGMFRINHSVLGQEEIKAIRKKLWLLKLFLYSEKVYLINGMALSSILKRAL